MNSGVPALIGIPQARGDVRTGLRSALCPLSAMNLGETHWTLVSSLLSGAPVSPPRALRGGRRDTRPILHSAWHMRVPDIDQVPWA